MESYKNFNEAMLAILGEAGEGSVKPRLLLHVCCAPCSSAVLERLAGSFEVILYFDNPNLDTGGEHALRALEVERLARETAWAKQVIITPYEPEIYLQAVHGLEDEPEGGARCEVCFRLRLSHAARAASEHGCDWFTTTLTISPRKNAAMLNRLGEEAGKAAGVPFLPSDFKKQGGYQRSIALSREFGLYRQNYCGCAFSRRDAEPRR